MFVKRILQLQTTKIVLLLILSLILLLIRPLFFPSLNYVPDAEHYAIMVEFFRGNVDYSKLIQEFRSRILVPLLASLLPWNAINSLTIVNIGFTLLSVLMFNRLLLFFNINEKQQILGTLIFIIAGPSIIDGSLPLTDSAGIFFTILSLYIYHYFENPQKKAFYSGIVLSIGTLAREPVIFILPVIISWIFLDLKFNWRVFIKLISLTSLFPLITVIILKTLIPTYYTWEIKFSLINYNINGLFQALTLATIAQLLLLFIIGLFGNYSKIIERSKVVWKLLIGMINFFLVIIYVFLSASIASRFFWIFFVFIIPFFLLGLKNFDTNLKK